jgi:hypothetical protein
VKTAGLPVDRQAEKDLADFLRSRGWAVLPPEQYLMDMGGDYLETWEMVKPYTMISPERGWALAEAVRYVCRRKLPGDFVECGVWKGGACLLASCVLAREETDSSRRIWLYDTFEGMVDPTPEDRIAASGQLLTERNPAGWWAAGVEEVKESLKKSPLDPSCFVFVAGRVEETLEKHVPEQIAILRLDTDWYESTRMELEVLYPRLVSGGILIIDDYGHFTGARKAVDEYFARKSLPMLLHRSDYTGRVIVKD